MGTRAGEWFNLKEGTDGEKSWQKQVTAEKTMHEFDPGSRAEGKERIPRKKRLLGGSVTLISMNLL